MATTVSPASAAAWLASWRPLASLRALSIAAVLALVAIGGSFALQAGRATQEAVLSAEASSDAERGVDETAELDLRVRERQRIGNLWVASGGVGAAPLREVEAGIRRSLAALRGAADGERERRLVGALALDLDAYLTTRTALEAEPLGVDEVIKRSRASLERALASDRAVRAALLERRDRARAAARRALERETRVAEVHAVLLATTVLALGLVARAAVLHPLRRLAAAMRRFRDGDHRPERVDAGPLRELRDLAAGLQELTEAVAGQRRQQLTFLAGVAHDLKNPLATLKLSVQALEREPSTISRERLRKLDRQLDRLTRMVGDLLDTTRIEAGELVLELTTTDLREVARTVVELYESTSARHQVTLVVSGGPVPVQADPLRLEQVVSNLVSNAIKYSPAGGPVVVAVERGEKAQLTVTDRGLGIPAEDLSRIFAPFLRRGPAAHAAPGAGLGLSIVRRIVGAHGGEVAVESTPGVGSTFRVLLPLAAAPPPGGARTAP